MLEVLRVHVMLLGDAQGHLFLGPHGFQQDVVPQLLQVPLVVLLLLHHALLARLRHVRQRGVLLQQPFRLRDVLSQPALPVLS